MSDDLFSQLFDLFNQPGPVNLKLAAEIARHLAGDPEPIDPWAAEEFRELTRVAEFRVEDVAPFQLVPAPDVMPVDSRTWAERNLEGFRYLAEPFAGIVDAGQAGPAGDILRQLGPALVGMQVGTLVGTLSKWVMASFDAGVPVQGDGPISYVVPVIDRFVAEEGFDPREVRLWVAVNESAHRAMFRVPFTGEHLVNLLGAYASTLRVSPDNLMELMQGIDPADLQSGVGAERIAGMFDNPESRQSQEELSAFLGLTAGYRRILVRSAAGELLPRLDEMDTARDAQRSLGDSANASAFASTFVDAGLIEKGRSFCIEIERRYGPEELARMWTQEGRFPTASELGDPVAWAARVLLDELES